MESRPAASAAPAALAEAGFRLGQWTAEPSLNRLSRNGTSVRIEPKVMDVLTALATHAGRVVPKSELKSAVWGREYLAESVLTRAVAELRRVLQDDAHAPRYIETIPKRGYRLIAPVTPLPKPEAPEAPPVVQARPRRGVWRLLAVAAMFASGLVWLAVRSMTPRTQPHVDETKKIVVLPLENIGVPQDSYFADGITEGIRRALGTGPQLAVISQTSAARYSSQGIPPAQIRQELGVDYVVTGTVLLDRAGTGGRVRLTLRLVRAADATQLWSESYDRRLEELFAVQSEIAARVAERLNVGLQHTGSQAAAAPTINLDAYESYLRGEEFTHRREPTRDDLVIAERLFTRAVELDPGFALGWAELADVERLTFTRYDPTEARRSQANEAIQRALVLRPGLPEAHLTYGWCLYWGERNLDRAWNEAVVAGRGLPNETGVYDLKAAVLRDRGQIAEAARMYERALALGPRDLRRLLNISEALTFLRRYEEAETYASRCIALAPDQTMGYVAKAQIYALWKGDARLIRGVLEAMSDSSRPDVAVTWAWQEVAERAYRTALARIGALPDEAFTSPEWPRAMYAAWINRLMGDRERAVASWAEAARLLQSALVKHPEDARLHSALGIALAGLGHRDEAIREGRRAVELVPVARDAFRGPGFVEKLAIIEMMVGDHELAIERLEYLLSIPSETSAASLRFQPIWDPLRDHPRFQRLLETSG